MVGHGVWNMARLRLGSHTAAPLSAKRGREPRQFVPVGGAKIGATQGKTSRVSPSKLSWQRHQQTNAKHYKAD